MRAVSAAARASRFRRRGWQLLRPHSGAVVREVVGVEVGLTVGTAPELPSRTYVDPASVRQADRDGVVRPLDRGVRDARARYRARRAGQRRSGLVIETPGLGTGEGMLSCLGSDQSPQGTSSTSTPWSEEHPFGRQRAESGRLIVLADMTMRETTLTMLTFGRSPGYARVLSTVGGTCGWAALKLCHQVILLRCLAIITT